MQIQKLSRLFKKSLIPLLILGTAMAAYAYMKATKPKQAPVAMQEKTWQVHTLSAQFESAAPVHTLYGTVESASMVSAAAPISGVVEQVHVKTGQEVNAGDVLVSMASADLSIPVQQAQADVAELNAQIKLQKLADTANVQRLTHEKNVLKIKQQSVARTQQLLAKDLVSRSALDTNQEALVKQEYAVVGAQLAVEENQLKVNQLGAKLQKSQAALAQARLNQQRGTVVAPYAARVASVAAVAGSRVNAGAELVRFYAFDSLELRAKLPLDMLAHYYQAQAKNQFLKAHYLQGEERIELSLSRVAGEASTSGVDAFFALAPGMQQTRPGDLLEIGLQGVLMHNVMSVPFSAIYGSDKVYVVENERLVSKTVEMMGSVVRDGKLWALIKPSFAAGSKVCITHLPNAVSGLKVTEVVL
ncbi:efflux RND transporter periplasmic adaptor subunit [Thiomicrorhabdus aquaedulcis]|uniref:efflux RND transporter periplasmic adaptor subunit n=1 Tax=Thiomicrorhabdus aquaedulcis TaxID=2211106 RepID=UPI000FD9A76F|nr:HlyD family efflux transporter periplasmic adaptor subunit [Thiomicrorhabdus aquaedulcis]